MRATQRSRDRLPPRAKRRRHAPSSAGGELNCPGHRRVQSDHGSPGRPAKPRKAARDSRSWRGNTTAAQKGYLQPEPTSRCMLRPILTSTLRDRRRRDMSIISPRSLRLVAGSADGTSLRQYSNLRIVVASLHATDRAARSGTRRSRRIAGSWRQQPARLPLLCKD